MSIARSSSRKNKISVAILDTGFSRQVAEFTSCDILFKDFCGVCKVAEDLDGHGSHLTGIIISQQPNLFILSGRVMTHTYLVALDPMVMGIRWAIAQKADIVLVAAGFSYDKTELRDAINEALDTNMLVISAIGNNGASGESAGHFPARYPGVVGVGSVNAKGEISDFSDRCPELDILAPGEDIKSFYLNGEMVEGSGTSQAAANVAGAVSNIIEAYKAQHMPYNAKSIIELLQRTGKPSSPSSGFKIIDQETALMTIRKS